MLTQFFSESTCTSCEHLCKSNFSWIYVIHSIQSSVWISVMSKNIESRDTKLVQFLFPYIWPSNQMYSIPVFAPTKTYLVLMRKFRSFLVQCAVIKLAWSNFLKKIVNVKCINLLWFALSFQKNCHLLMIECSFFNNCLPWM